MYVVASTDFFLLLVSFRSSNRSTPGLSAFIAASGVGSFHSHLSPPSGQLGEPLAVSSLQCLVPNRFPGRSHSSFRTPTELVFVWIVTGTRLGHIIELSDQKI
jgi:hypothetical protein